MLTEYRITKIDYVRGSYITVGLEMVKPDTPQSPEWYEEAFRYAAPFTVTMDLNTLRDRRQRRASS